MTYKADSLDKPAAAYTKCINIFFGYDNTAEF